MDFKKELDFDIDEAIRMFNRIYPEFRAVPVDISYDKKKLIVFVGDGYHAIDENSVSTFYDDLDTAKRG